MITGAGDSASTLQTQQSARNCFNAYAALNGMESLMKTPRDTFCTEEFFQTFAYYLTSVYKTKESGFLKKSTVLGYIGCILVIGQDTLFKGNITYQIYFTGRYATDILDYRRWRFF